ncbi:hypothetical protein Y032_0031g2309 [Ancylostoma ceylanicum]|uniref:Uncharacterized protein n=1 Tax=Ancylostoma ceylanicum TaxID=53326 RepID=A0A016UQR4_9BILA|nr:hypothetical protein Y032_0031g2309 [Ancylostoma ceylanicum]
MSKLVGHRFSRGGQPAHARTAPPMWSVSCTLDPPKNRVFVTFVTFYIYFWNQRGKEIKDLWMTLSRETR